MKAQDIFCTLNGCTSASLDGAVYVYKEKLIMRSAMALLSTIFLVACTTHTTHKADNSPWQSFGYKGMADKINRLAGSNSLNCGIHNYLEQKDPVNQHISPKQSKACIKAAIKSQTPFRYGSIRIPTDSFLFEALILNESGEYWIIRYDSMIDGSDSQHFISRCKAINIDFNSISYEGSVQRYFS